MTVYLTTKEVFKWAVAGGVGFMVGCSLYKLGWFLIITYIIAKGTSG